MLLLNVFLLLFITFASARRGIENDLCTELSWPEEYSCEANKLYLESGLVEDFKIWHTSKKSRIDYNKGAVKSIVVPSKSRRSYGLKYEIHPETTNYELNSMVCEITKGTREDRQEIETILPSTDDYEYEFEGLENINDLSCCKYYAVSDDDEYETRVTIWTSVSSESNTSVPIRHEEKKFNKKRGYLDLHYIWDFYNYNYDINDTVFNTSNYDCSYSTKTLSESNSQNIDPEKDEHVDKAFNAFKTKYEKKYAHDREHAMRRSIFLKNLRLITSTNAHNLSYKLSINEFADRTPEEMTRHMGLLRVKKRTPGNFPFPYDAAKLNELSDGLPSEYDSRLYGLVNPIKNQQACGSCWTFGTTAAVEGAYARKNGGRLLTLSNQALIDCAWGTYNNFGCNGGADTGAYQWMMDYGLPTEEDYGTYANQDGYCLIENMTTTYPILGFTDITPNSINALKVALINHGPVSTSVHATNSFSYYSGGIFYDITCDPTSLNHEVSIVGYGEENGETFLILRNSWGPNWGIDGYMHISARDNNCGVLTEPTYVVV